MAEITAKLVKELREKSGAGVMDAKKALVEVEGDIEKAIELLREKGMAKAAKKADRVAAEGLTGVYVNGNVAAVVEVNAETDFVAKNAQFVELVNETAKVIAEGKPANNEEALALTMPSGETLEAAYVTATATIGEKISFRRFAVVEKTDAQHFGAYQHNGGRIGVVSVIEGGDDALAKQISMHIAAMKPTVLSYTEGLSPISPSISARGTKAATESTTTKSTAPESISLPAISRPCSPESGCDKRSSSILTPRAAA